MAQLGAEVMHWRANRAGGMRPMLPWLMVGGPGVVSLDHQVARR